MIFQIKFFFFFLVKYFSYYLPAYKYADRRKILQRKKLKKILKYAKRKSSFYKKELKLIDPDHVHLQDLPVVDKNILLHNLEDVLTVDLKTPDIEKYLDTEFALDKKYKNKYLIFHTSGSSGSSVHVVWGAKEFATATAMLLVKNTGLLTAGNPFELIFRRKRYLYIGITDDYIGGNSWVYAMRHLVKLKIISIFTPLEEMLEEIKEFKPEFIMAKPHVLGEIAEKIWEDSINNIKPEKLIFVGEMLTERDKSKIKEGFDMLAVNSYSTCETGPIAYEEFPNTLTIMDEEVILELLDDSNHPIKEYYQLGHIVITNLYNKVMPVIRYDIGDMAYFVPNNRNSRLNCICYIKGRSTSYFTFQSDNSEKIRISEYPFWSIDIPGIAHYQIVQTDDTGIKVLLEFEKEAKDKEGLKNKFEKKVKRIFPKEFADIQLVITYEYVDKIPVTKSGKIIITLPLKNKDVSGNE